MRIRRDISSIPHRSATETWQTVIDLITGPDSVDVKQLTDARGVMGSIITDEHPSSRPIRLEGVGSQLRLYCRYGMKAVEEAGAIDRLTWNPTAGDWTMHVPCDSENLAWVRTSLAKTSGRIKAFDVATPDDSSREEAQSLEAGSLVVDWNVKG